MRCSVCSAFQFVHKCLHASSELVCCIFKCLASNEVQDSASLPVSIWQGVFHIFVMPIISNLILVPAVNALFFVNFICTYFVSYYAALFWSQFGLVIKYPQIVQVSINKIVTMNQENNWSFGNIDILFFSKRLGQ